MRESDLSGAAVSRRLAILRALWRPLDREQARSMMQTRQPKVRELTPAIVAARLAELRALYDLDTYLRGSARDGASRGADE
jgi:hypothetical protein